MIAYAIAGSIACNLDTEPLGVDAHGNAVYLRDIWPSADEIAQALASSLTSELYAESYARLFEGAPAWQVLKTEATALFPWSAESTFLRRPPFFDDVPQSLPPLRELRGMRPLAILGDMVTTDHLSPNNVIPVKAGMTLWLGGRAGARPTVQP